jgi:hypothetical protein
MVCVDTVLKILNCRNGGETTKCFSRDIGRRNRAVFFVYGMKIVPVHCMELYVECGSIAAHFPNVVPR